MVAGTECQHHSFYSMAAVIPNVSRISSRIIRILGCNPGPMTLQGTNTYIIGTGKRRILLDTGDADVPQYINHLKTVLNNEKIDLAHVFISHWHHDHIGGVSDVMGIEENTKFCQVWKFPHEKDSTLTNVTLDQLKDGQEFSVEGATLRVLHTPGHTTDHVSFHLLEENAIFSGDCVLGEGTAIFEDLYDYMNSLKQIMDVKASIIYPGHGNIIHDPMERLKFYVDHRNERELQILHVLGENPDTAYTPVDIVTQVYTGLSEKLVLAASVNVSQHLEKLAKERKVCKIDDGHWQYMQSTNI